jgi:hypothetical protein
MFNKETRYILNQKRDFLYALLFENTDLDLLKVGDTDLIIAEDLEIVGLTDATFQVTHEGHWILDREEKAFFNADVCGAYISRHGRFKDSEYVRDVLSEVNRLVATWYTFAKK